MMNWFDIIIIIILIGAFIKGLHKGFVKQLFGLVGIIAGAIFAGRVASLILPFLIHTVNISPNVAGVFSYIIAFTIIILLIRIVASFFHRLLKLIQIGFLNSTLGAVLSIGCTMIILSILLNLAVVLDPEEEVITKDIKENTFFYSRVQVVVPTVVPYLKNSIWNRYYLDELNEKEEEEQIEFLETYYT